MLKRPTPHPVLSAVRIAFTVLLAVHVFISAWLVATVDGAYTEGKPSPTEVHSLVAIDKDQTVIDVEITKATSFFAYTLSRDGSAEAPSNQTMDDEEKEDGKPSSTVDWLSLGRGLVTCSLVLLVVSEILVITHVRFASWLRFGAFMLTLLMIFIVFPASYMFDLGSSASPAENTPGFELDGTSFVHVETSSDRGLKWIGFELDTSFSGYDLGLVAEENRTSVVAAAPPEGSEDAASFIAFESTFSIAYGKNLDALFVLPALWFILPSNKPKPSTENEVAPTPGIEPGSQE